MRFSVLVLSIVIALSLFVILNIGLVSQQAKAESLFELNNSPTQTVIITGCLSSSQFQPVLDEFYTRTSVTTQYDDSCDREQIASCVDNHNCPDVAIIPWPGLLAELGDGGALIDLDTFISSTVLITNYSDAWIDLGKVDSTFYGVWFNANNKSLIWYDPTEFSSHVWVTPTTWTGMMTLTENISNSTSTPPWSIGIESGGASGWPLTDWFENILLRSAGPTAYDNLTAHTIPWTHTEVVSAMTYLAEVIGNEDYQLGGKAGTINTSFIDAMYPPFEVIPEAYLHHQAAFAQNLIGSHFPAQTAGTDYATFPFPDFNLVYTNAVMGTGDVIIVFTDTTETQDLVNFLITTDAAEIWIGEGGMSPNRNVDPNQYPDPNTRSAAERLANADIIRIDLTDQLPSDLNAYIYTQMDDLVMAAPDQAAMQAVLKRIEWYASDTLNELYLPMVIR